MTPTNTSTEGGAGGSSFYYSSSLPADGAARSRPLMHSAAGGRRADEVSTRARPHQLAWWRRSREPLAGHPRASVRGPAPFVEAYGSKRHASTRSSTAWNGSRLPPLIRFESLKLYCHSVAGVVGSCRHRSSDTETRRRSRYARLRSACVPAHASTRRTSARTRVATAFICPRTSFARFGLTAWTSSRDARPRVSANDDIPGERAQSYYELAYSKVAPGDRASQRGSSGAIYRTLLDEIRARVQRASAGARLDPLNVACGGSAERVEA